MTILGHPSLYKRQRNMLGIEMKKKKKKRRDSESQRLKVVKSLIQLMEKCGVDKRKWPTVLYRFVFDGRAYQTLRLGKSDLHYYSQH